MLMLNRKYIRKRIALLLGAGLILFCSCGRPSTALQFLTLGDEGWPMYDTLCFAIDSVEVEGDYSLAVALRTSSAKSYPYRQLVMEVQQQWAHECEVRKDTLCCELIEVDGELSGDGVAIYAYEYPVDTLHLQVGDSAKLCLRHLMRKSPLPGIYNIGIVLEPLTAF